MPVTQRLQQQKKREAKLNDMRQQVAQGKLVIRQMTSAERKQYPPLERTRTRGAAKRT